MITNSWKNTPKYGSSDDETDTDSDNDDEFDNKKYNVKSNE